MTAHRPPPVVPKLRFPEFRRAGEWETKPISKLAHIAKGVQLNRATITEGEFSVWNGGVTPSGFHNEWNTEGETITISEGGNSCGFVNRSNQRFWLGGHCYALKNLSSEIDGTFLFQSLKSNETEIMRLRVGSGLPNIQRHELEQFPVAFPHPAEQQKIAECLGSLDDLIAAEGRKLEVLRQHKQGLLQQIFPQAGENVPIRRFAHSDDESKWQYKVLPEIATNLNNRRIPVTEQDRIPGEVPYYGASGIVDYVKDHIFDEDLLCVSEDGANLSARTHPIAFSISGRTWVNNHAHVLRFEKSATQLLVQAYLNHIDISDYLTGMAQPKLNRAMLDSIPISLPPTPHEENDIAGCIASLDHLLSMHHKKLELLSAHKQGLLQQLFPIPHGEWR